MKRSLDDEPPLLDCGRCPTAVPRNYQQALGMLRLIYCHARLGLDSYPRATEHELRN
jgi:hypothetical protein